MSTKEAPHHDVDFDVIAVDLSWKESYGTPRYVGVTAASHPSWDDAFEVRLCQVEQTNPSQSKPESERLVLPIGTALQRPGPKSTRNGVAHARLLVRPASWVAKLGVRVTLRDHWRWVADQQAIVFHPELGWIDIDVLASPLPNRGSIQFEAVAE
jgi:hypothetical protein